ncbi:hypothetical protein [Metabacillus indicus]|uniref:hypothetical protein n=1 Tax=Metabacillus indicus TaxID=246786 RepID=UPI003CE937A8
MISIKIYDEEFLSKDLFSHFSGDANITINGENDKVINIHTSVHKTFIITLLHELLILYKENKKFKISSFGNAKEYTFSLNGSKLNVKEIDFFNKSKKNISVPFDRFIDELKMCMESYMNRIASRNPKAKQNEDFIMIVNHVALLEKIKN